MAKISALSALTGANAASGDLITLVDISDTTFAASGTNKKMTLDELRAYLALGAGLPLVKSLASDAASNSTTTAAKITSLDLAVGVGNWAFQYFIRYQAAAATTGVKFSVNHTGTLTAFMANMRWVDVSNVATAAATSAPTQAGNTNNVIQGVSARAKSTAAGMGPTLSVDTLNADMLMIIEGLLVCTVAGNIELYHASEVAAASTVKAGTSLIITKTG